MPNTLAKISLAIICLLILPVFSTAQMDINLPYALSNELVVEMTPNYPRPNETVSTSLKLYTDNLDASDISWYKDGKNVLSGKGEKNYSFQTGSAGTETKIEIRIKLTNGSSFSKSFSIIPISVDLVWESYSYTPPFYRGKALHPRQGVLKIVAMPEFVKNGKRIPPQNLIYKWTNGLDVLEDQSGYGKNSIIINGSVLGKREAIEVLVTDPTSNLTAQGYISIAPVDPEIIFYRNDPYYGFLFNSAISKSFDLDGDEVQILAAPFYFTMERSGVLDYGWRLNNESIPSLSGSQTAVFRKPEDQAGISIISLNIQNPNRILQQADSNLTMNFEE